MVKVHELGFKLLPHPPYFPDLASSDFFLFPNLKIWLEGKRFSSDEEFIAAVDKYFKRRLNILSLALSWAVWCCLCGTHVIFNRFEPPLKGFETSYFSEGMEELEER